MQRKPIILILTSKDEIDGVSHQLQAAIQNLGTHNVVIVGDDKYGSAIKLSHLDRLMNARHEYQGVLEKKRNSKLAEKIKFKPLSKRAYRISNAVKRFNPDYILTVTPYAHYAAIEAKRRTNFKTPIAYMMLSFALDKRSYDENTSLYLVENADIKADLVKCGIRSKEIITIGLPFGIKDCTPPEIAAAKQEFGLPRTKTVFVNVSNKRELEEIVALLTDQGDIINLVVFAEESRELAEIRAQALGVSGMTTIFVTKADLFDSYLSVSDIVITEYDVATIYKCFISGIPVVTFGKGENTVKDINYLVANGLLFYAKDNMDIVALLYKLLQTDVSVKVVAAAEKWVEFCSLDNIASFLDNYLR
ncbi:MAG: hypothetical protein RSB59_01600 [Clostridia bacterium]